MPGPRSMTAAVAFRIVSVPVVFMFGVVPRLSESSTRIVPPDGLFDTMRYSVPGVDLIVELEPAEMRLYLALPRSTVSLLRSGSWPTGHGRPPPRQPRPCRCGAGGPSQR